MTPARAVVARDVVAKWMAYFVLPMNQATPCLDKLVEAIDAALRERERAGYDAGQAAMLHELNQAHGVAQALEQQLLQANECWEPGHTYTTEPPYVEQRRQTKVHCVICTDRAMENARRETWRAASELARTYFDPCDEPADISARECGEQIAAALAARGEVS